MKYLIVGNGPFVNTHLITEAKKESCVLALDGAANKLIRLGIKPNLILGDFDSFQEEKLLSDVKKITRLDQDTSDFQKAIYFALYEAIQEGFELATEIHVLCAMGGRLDHDQANIRTLKIAYQKKCPIYLHNDNQTLRFVSNEKITVTGKKGDYCGFFGMPEATMLIKKNTLAYGEKEIKLSLTTFSASNRLVSEDEVIIEFQGDALVVLPPFFSAQKRCS